jgi:hypothetical protein
MFYAVILQQLNKKRAAHTEYPYQLVRMNAVFLLVQDTVHRIPSSEGHAAEYAVKHWGGNRALENAGGITTPSRNGI